MRVCSDTVLTSRDQLRLALEIIDRVPDVLRRGWTKHTYARDVRGRAVAPVARDAASWCVIGATGRAAMELTAEGMIRGVGPLGPFGLYAVTVEALQDAARRLYDTHCSGFNDDDAKDAEDVLPLVKQARVVLEEWLDEFE